MIFKPEMIDKILAGEKTVTRRPVKYRFSSNLAGGFGRIKRERPCRYKAGRSYFIRRGPGEAAAGRIRVLSVETVALGFLDDEEARLEGFESGEHFEAFWQLLFDNCDPMQPVHRIEFELISATPTQHEETP